MFNLLCKIGLHKPTPIGEAPYLYDLNKTIIGMGCKRCGKKLSKGYLIDNSKRELFYKSINK